MLCYVMLRCHNMIEVVNSPALAQKSSRSLLEISTVLINDLPQRLVHPALHFSHETHPPEYRNVYTLPWVIPPLGDSLVRKSISLANQDLLRRQPCRADFPTFERIEWGQRGWRRLSALLRTHHVFYRDFYASDSQRERLSPWDVTKNTADAPIRCFTAFRLKVNWLLGLGWN